MRKRVKRAVMRNEIMLCIMGSVIRTVSGFIMPGGTYKHVYDLNTARTWIKTTGFWP